MVASHSTRVSPKSRQREHLLEAQHAYVTRMQEAGFDYGLAVADAFIRGMRNIGYKSTGSALDELIDNAIQADARTIHVVLNGPPEGRTIQQIAVLDDGHGMEPDMIRLA